MDQVTLTTLSAPPPSSEMISNLTAGPSEQVSAPVIAIVETNFVHPSEGNISLATTGTVVSHADQTSEKNLLPKSMEHSQTSNKRKNNNATTKKAAGSSVNSICPANNVEAQIGVIFSQLVGVNRKLENIITTLQQQISHQYQMRADLNTIMEYYRDEQERDDSFIEEDPSTEEETSEEDTDDEELRLRHRKRQEKSGRVHKKRRHSSEGSENSEAAIDSSENRKIIVSSASERSESDNEISARESEDERDQVNQA